MADASEIRGLVLDLLRERPEVGWVASQLQETLADGISMTVRDSADDAVFMQLEPTDLSTRERQKREKYETTRPYTDEEASELIIGALKELFETLPAVQTAALERVRSLAGRDVAIEFFPPDEVERGEPAHRLTTENYAAYQQDLEIRLDKFLSELQS